MYFVYALKSLTRNYIYVGLSDNLERRVEEHNSGWERTTKPYRPFKLIFTELLVSRPDARKKERYLKSGVGKEFLKSLQVSGFEPACRQAGPAFGTKGTKNLKTVGQTTCGFLFSTNSNATCILYTHLKV